MDRIVVILLNYNSAEDCKKCISFLEEQEGVELDIIIVDNASTLEDREELRKLENWAPHPQRGDKKVGESCKVEKVKESSGKTGAIKNLTIIEAKENRGYNAGNNIGLRYAAEKGYQWALIANPDMEFPDPFYMKKMLKVVENTESTNSPNSHNFNNSDNFNKIVIVASDIVTPEGIHQNPMLPDGDWKTSFGWIKGLLKKQKKKDVYDYTGNFQVSGYCSKVSGCALLAKMDFIKEIGFFDENPFLYCEEAILAKQVERTGKKMFYLADITAIHRHVKSDKGDPRPRFHQWNRSRQYYIKKYSDYPWYGKLFASLSISLYTTVLILASSLRSK